MSTNAEKVVQLHYLVIYYYSQYMFQIVTIFRP